MQDFIVSIQSFRKSIMFFKINITVSLQTIALSRKSGCEESPDSVKGQGCREKFPGFMNVNS